MVRIFRQRGCAQPGCRHIECGLVPVKANLHGHSLHSGSEKESAEQEAAMAVQGFHSLLELCEQRDYCIFAPRKNDHERNPVP
jgi:hypothetical protein